MEGGGSKRRDTDWLDSGIAERLLLRHNHLERRGFVIDKRRVAISEDWHGRHGHLPGTIYKQLRSAVKVSESCRGARSSRGRVKGAGSMTSGALVDISKIYSVLLGNS